MESKSILSKLKKPILKILFSFIGIRELMEILKYNKLIQNKMNIGLCTYIIFSNFVTQKIEVLNNKKLENFYESLIMKLKRNELEEIHIGLSTCIIFALKYNYSYDADMINFDLYPIYYQLQYHFNINVNLMFGEKFFNKKLFNNIHYINFIKNNFHIFSGITFNQIQSEILLNNCIENNEKKLLFDNLELKQICFKNMKLTKDIIYLLNYFNLSNIEILYFINCKLTLNCFEIFSQKISSNDKYFTKLVLSNCMINEKNIEKSINNYHYLSYINLEKNKINDNTMDILMEMDICKKKLQGLNLSNNKFSFKSFQKISNSNNYFSNLKNLDLTNNNLTYSIKYIFKWNNPNLIFLNLSNCEIEDYEFNNDLINNLINLTNLILNKNNIGKAAIRFCFLIKSLILLKVSSCNLTNDSFFLINEIKNDNLKFLIVSKNNIKSESTISIFKNSILQKLISIDLFNNQLNDDFADYFINNKNIIPIKMLNIGLNNNISKEKKNQIYSLYQKYIQITNKSII